MIFVALSEAESFPNDKEQVMRNRFRPTLETLESRLVPSTYDYYWTGHVGTDTDDASNWDTNPANSGTRTAAIYHFGAWGHPTEHEPTFTAGFLPFTQGCSALTLKTEPGWLLNHLDIDARDVASQSSATLALYHEYGEIRINGNGTTRGSLTLTGDSTWIAGSFTHTAGTPAELCVKNTSFSVVSSPGSLEMDLHVGSGFSGSTRTYGTGNLNFGTTTTVMSGPVTLNNGACIRVDSNSTATVWGTVNFTSNAGSHPLAVTTGTFSSIVNYGQVFRLEGSATTARVDVRLWQPGDGTAAQKAITRTVIGYGTGLDFEYTDAADPNHVSIGAGVLALSADATLQVGNTVIISGGGTLALCAPSFSGYADNANFSQTLTGKLYVNGGAVYLGVTSLSGYPHSTFFDTLAVAGDVTADNSASLSFGLSGGANRTCDKISLTAGINGGTLTLATQATINVAYASIPTGTNPTFHLFWSAKKGGAGGTPDITSAPPHGWGYTYDDTGYYVVY